MVSPKTSGAAVPGCLSLCGLRRRRRNNRRSDRTFRTLFTGLAPRETARRRRFHANAQDLVSPAVTFERTMPFAVILGQVGVGEAAILDSVQPNQHLSRRRTRQPGK